MATSSGNSSGSAQLLNYSGSESDPKVLMDMRKRKRMESNRESARRSRMRKQKHLTDLTSQVTDLRKENGQIQISINVANQHLINIEAENSILKAQMLELQQRLDSLQDIVRYMDTSTDSFLTNDFPSFPHHCALGGNGNDGDSYFMSSFNNMMHLNQPIMPSNDLFLA